MQSHIPAALGGRPSPFGPPLHAAGDPSRPSSTSAPSPFAQSPLGHSPFSQSSGLSSSAASRAISPRLSNGNTPAGAVSPLSGTRSPTLSAARPDHLRTSSLTGTPAVSLAGATGLGVGSSVAPSNDDIEAVIQLAMASSPAGSAGGRDTRTQLFVGNLPYRVRWQDLKDLFRRAGTVLRADVALGPDNRSRGHGTVLLASQEDAERAIGLFQGWCWQGRVLEVRKDRVISGEEGLSVGSALPSPMAGAGFGPALGNGVASPSPAQMGRFNTGMALGVECEDSLSVLSAGMSRPGTGSGPGASVSRNLFVGNLPFHIQWQDLKDLFRQAGAVTRADVALGADGRSRGFGTVSFSNEQDAERAVRMFNGYEYNGRALKVHFDKFSAPAATAQLAVPSLASSAPHSPSSAGFQPQPFQGQLAFAQASFAQQLLTRQNSQQPPMRQGPDSFPYNPYENPRGPEPLATVQAEQSMPEGLPTQIPMQYRFEFLSSGPSTPYEWYGDANGMRFGPSEAQAQALQPSVSGLSTQAEASGSGDGVAVLASGSAVEAAVMQDQSRIGQPSENGQQSQQPRPPPLSLAHSHVSGSGSKPPSQEQIVGSSAQVQQPTSQSGSQTGSQPHSTPQQHQHPAHPGPIALPPPPPVTAFPVPPPHTLSPQYYSPIMHPGHPQSPYHHPAMAMGMGVAMTPHGLPPITPSMPSFSFVSQPSPVPQDPNAPNAQGGGGAPVQSPYDPARHMPHHVMTPFAPFSPGVTMSPGAFWGRPGSGAVNPFINPAVGAPVHGSPGYFWPPRGQPSAEEQGYFPPVPPQPQPEGSYFPSVPPSASRPSGLANELGRGDSGSDPASSRLGAEGSDRPENGRTRSGASEATTATGATGTGSRPSSSQGTSWQTDVDSEDPGMVALEKEIDALAVADDDAVERRNGEHAKPRAYSAQAAGAEHPPPFTRAGSDPVDVRPGAEAAGAAAVSLSVEGR